ncbi:hypothetical protein D5V04_02370 [Campylobacter jejuni]|nr:hypothetical protein [Campylobacter jejuni]EAB5358590.1 hypothetical protein [Campylobacter jejuni]EAH5002310.1 hypothetical protein [Campylobacter jejuni]EAH5041499.1 hypothetical protein [Campylobacter jejuni]EAH5222533.1 hypothetical protein [Campylobacter jejuni]
MRFIHQFINNSTSIFSHLNIISFSHKMILAFLFLIFFCACGYKGNPQYTSYEQNGSVKTIKKYEQLHRW